jgi:predicted RNA-binding Zn-ribbon protein involved in translation (DUF1610 family)
VGVTVDPKRNPGWVRPADWMYEEDWGSPAWKERMAKNNAEAQGNREKYGFDICPKCGTEHTARTITCRECGHKNAC